MFIVALPFTPSPQEPSLYPLTLSYFSSSPSRLTSATPDLLKVLDHIDQQDLLPPLQVVQALSQTSVATIGMIKNYIGHRIEAERKERIEDQKQIQSYRQESEKKRREIDDLKTAARIFQVTKCSACGGSLDLPSVHFLCRHSYHQRCLSDSADRECPKCMVEQRTVADIRRMQEANAEKHDLFISEVSDPLRVLRCVRCNVLWLICAFFMCMFRVINLWFVCFNCV